MYQVKIYRLDNNIIRKLIVYTSKERVLQEYSLANKYLNIRKNKIRNIEYFGRQYVNHVVRFLNFLLEYRNKFFELDYADITLDDAQDFLDWVSEEPGKTGVEPLTSTIKEYRKDISNFLLNLKEQKVCAHLDEHYLMRRIDERSKYIEYELNIYSKFDEEENRNVIRDCPEFFVEAFLRNARRYDPEVYILASLQINAGLRPAEACNLRMVDSCYGAGYQMVHSEIDGKDVVVSMVIDLTKASYKRMLRSDGVKTGGIKKPRKIDVYFPFLTRLAEDINDYLKYSETRNREITKPLVTCSHKTNGYHMAITYNAYHKRFKSLCVKYVFPELEQKGMSSQWYVEKLKSGSYGPHMFRDYFTCRLVKMGLPWSEIMRYRGDKNEKSAIVYVLKGGAFEDSILHTEQLLCQEVKFYGEEMEKITSIPFRL